ncbi:transporter [Desulfuromonas versatilis]|uniref:Transporter n=1 Tax=Desulfuromonas versatilis TaxID=2802975 RepID=A0ABM8HRS9_9BACT|nr:DMT family transporter [Desulfuromonas versatilis]BCR03656.1 transporter [Desulfuromonas versatilis]
MQNNSLKADALLFLTAAIWGFAFVAQRVGMDYIGPFTYNGIRFALGSLSLLPLIYLSRRAGRQGGRSAPAGGKVLLYGGLMAGGALFLGASLQQAGLVYTTAGNAGFITGLYVVLVPILGLFWKQRPGAGTWLGASLALVGLYLLSVTEQFTMAFGDVLVLIGAFFWAGHVLLIGWLSPRMDALKLSAIQFAVCAVLSLLTALLLETITLDSVLQATVPILYGGLMSVGVAYTLQVVAQRDAHPAHTAILLSLEGVFAAIGGWLLLGETLGPRALLGCALMLSGMLLSELSAYLFRPRACRSQEANS